MFKSNRSKKVGRPKQEKVEDEEEQEQRRAEKNEAERKRQAEKRGQVCCNYVCI